MRGGAGMTTKSRFVFPILLLLLLTSSARAADNVPIVSGPVSGGTHGRPFTASLADLAASGYVEDEYFIAGTATSYRAGKVLDSDGAWSVVPAGSQPYKTRLLVRRPKNPAHFNGTVVVEWQNVSGGFDVDAEWGYAYPELMREGYVWVGVSAQHAGVMGPPLRAGFSQPLTLWDPARYGSLSIPGDDFSYDIFTQAARLVGPHRPPVTPDPLYGLKVARVLGIGASQSANRLVTYANAVQPVANVLDGILIASRIGQRGGAAPLAADLAMPDPVKIRTDLKIPVLVVETESDALSHYPARMPDTDHYRLWELAGTAHQNQWADSYFGAEIKRDLGGSGPGDTKLGRDPCAQPLGQGRQGAGHCAADRDFRLAGRHRTRSAGQRGGRDTPAGDRGSHRRLWWTWHAGALPAGGFHGAARWRDAENALSQPCRLCRQDQERGDGG
jgi:hypothetical protein